MKSSAAELFQRISHTSRRDALTALGAMVVAGLLLVAMQFFALDRTLRQELDTQARILAETTQAAVVFSDAAEARALLGPLRAHSAIDSARLLDAAGRTIALYRAEREHVHWTSHLAAAPVTQAPILAGTKVIGQVELVACTTPMWQQLGLFAGATLLIMVIALCLVVWGSRRLLADVHLAEGRQRYLAVHDALTGLTNRDTFCNLLEQAAGKGAQAGGFALLFIDLDNFKRVNDTFGHAGGDALLRCVAGRLRAQVRTADVVARLGGDEFAILLAAPTTGEAARRVATGILQDLALPLAYQDDTILASASVGVALYPNDALSAEGMLQCADAAMYHAKRLGKNALEFYSARLADNLSAQRAIEQDLRHALVDDGLWLAYQPIFDGQSNIVSVEALVRWTHPVRGLVSPGEFVPVAEACDLMPELGLAIVGLAARDIEAWRARGLQAPRVAINLSSRQFVRDRHQAQFLAALTRLRLAPREVSFELTESAVFEDLSSPNSIIAALQSRGYSLALDDFGTGYSSLAYLLRLRCDTLKIDRVFVHGVSASKESTLLVSSMVHVAHALGMQVVAEGVEDLADLAHVRSLGCDAVQGFVLSKPISAAAMAALLTRVEVPVSV